ncbi:MULTISPECIES: DUF4286 family protein [unclassified Bosea (in: a-proteobacteria)]|uniref:DUF4286 family protein n=1 Tax=unclassified Bosea (in: a-proteobacteria) TaxID=2653178 RepID=UPI000F74EA7A|nr:MULTISPECIES: DUF4286 family protein [unclassified Bosea (in: a-proteobacteria)]AZO81037.1 hypothetical protein BLM15_28325 [Bosea sp. Tri-49]RXT26004.1 hypothetical protein B5U98_05475 [Bosea sp. Tri-39]RXT31246.1 hypothetical protein B5U99_21020 [Bosea sp. Tri-54]
MRSSAFLIFANDVVPEQRAAYESWHGGHHVPQRLTVPGILRATRYRTSGGSPEYLTVYDLADIAVLTSPDYRRLAEQPDVVTQAMRPYLRDPLRLACRSLVAADCSHGELLIMLRMPDVSAAQVAEWLAGQASATVRLGRTAPDAGGHPIMGQAGMPQEAVALVFAAASEAVRAMAEGMRDAMQVEILSAPGSGLIYERIESFP